MNWTETFRPERRATWTDMADAVRETVTMSDVIGKYCPECVPRHNRIPCPIHQGRDYNFSFNDTGYCCFVCGATGDVIKFVQTVCCLRGRKDAVAQINRDFGLFLPVDREISSAENKALEERRKAAREREERRAEWEEGLSALWDEWCRLDRQKRDCRPGTDAWAEAVRNIDGVSWQIDAYPPEPR